eukprot:TRINITY_DN2480_c0_g2_i1.p1 TRINITY_DN2480_c0_g2~~TRINITY_DN2480_c0_g2_i1.p1  ORF type:complete len:544 (+),score=21.33 TRINITY_DN2480_c0_g2_i1:66-1697(+)
MCIRDSYYILLALMVENVYKIIYYSWHSRFFLLPEKLRNYLIISEGVWLILYKGLLILHMEYRKPGLWFTLAPLILYVALRFCCCISDRTRLECSSFIDFVTMIIRCFSFFQLILIYFKLDNIVPWDWREVFWMYWFFFALMLGILCGLFFLISTKLCFYIKSRVASKEIKILIWIFFLILGASLSTCSIVWIFSGDLVVGVDPRSNFNLKIAFLSLLCFLVCFWIFTICIRSSLVEFFENLSTADDSDFSIDEIPTPIITSRTTESRRRNKQKRISKSSFNTSGKTLFLKKLSSTYFKIVDGMGQKTSINQQKYGVSLEKTSKTTEITNNEGNNPSRDLRISYGGYDHLMSTSRQLMSDHDALSPGSASSRSRGFSRAIKEHSPREVRVNRSLDHKIEEDEHESASQEPNFNKTMIEKRHTRFNLEEPLPITDFTKKNPSVNNSLVVAESGQGPVGGPLEQSNTACVICFEKFPDAVLLDCGHGGICYDCAIDIWQRNEECYLCRKPVVQILQMEIATRHQEVIKIISYTDKIEVEENSFNK